MISIQKLPSLGPEMRETLRSHILRKRQRLKQELEQDAIEKRLKMEREIKRAQDALTLDQIKDQLLGLEKKLENLKTEKHNLFVQLKQVLSENQTKRKQDQEAQQQVDEGQKKQKLESNHQNNPTATTTTNNIQVQQSTSFSGQQFNLTNYHNTQPSSYNEPPQPRSPATQLFSKFPPSKNFTNEQTRSSQPEHHIATSSSSTTSPHGMTALYHQQPAIYQQDPHKLFSNLRPLAHQQINQQQLIELATNSSGRSQNHVAMQTNSIRPFEGNNINLQQSELPTQPLKSQFLSHFANNLPFNSLPPSLQLSAVSSAVPTSRQYDARFLADLAATSQSQFRLNNFSSTSRTPPDSRNNFGVDFASLYHPSNQLLLGNLNHSNGNSSRPPHRQDQLPLDFQSSQTQFTRLLNQSNQHQLEPTISDIAQQHKQPPSSSSTSSRVRKQPPFGQHQTNLDFLYAPNQSKSEITQLVSNPPNGLYPTASSANMMNFDPAAYHHQHLVAQQLNRLQYEQASRLYQSNTNFPNYLNQKKPKSKNHYHSNK